MTLRTLLAFALVAWLPGALLFRLPLLDPRGRAALPAEERVLWAVVLSSGLSVMLTLGLAVFGWYRFERLLLIEAGIVVALAIVCRGRLRLGPEAPRPGPRRAGAGRHRGGRAVALRDAGGVRPRRQGSRRLRQRGRADRATRRAAGARSGHRLGARRVPRARDPVAQHAELLQLALHGLLRHRSGGGHDPRPVPALPAGLDRHRLRPRRAHRRAPRHALLGAARPGQRLHPGRAAVRPDGGGGGHRSCSPST